MPIAYEFAPDFVIGILIPSSLSVVLPSRAPRNAKFSFLVSAGFDAAIGDPLGECKVSPAGYAHMTYMLSSLANGRLVLALEVSSEVRSNRHETNLNTGWIQCRLDCQLGARMRQSASGRSSAAATSYDCQQGSHRNHLRSLYGAEQALEVYYASARLFWRLYFAFYLPGLYACILRFFFFFQTILRTERKTMLSYL
jgi:hypothetical protein